MKAEGRTLSLILHPLPQAPTKKQPSRLPRAAAARAHARRGYAVQTQSVGTWRRAPCLYYAAEQRNEPKSTCICVQKNSHRRCDLAHWLLN